MPRPMMRKKHQKAPSEPLQCYFCANQNTAIDYKNMPLMKKFMSPHAKIMGRKRTGSCAAHQHTIARALKYARHMALMPFVAP